MWTPTTREQHSRKALRYQVVHQFEICPVAGQPRSLYAYREA